MKKTITLCVAVLLATGSALAQSVVVTDGNGNLYGNTMGFAIDFDSTIASGADWTADLQSGLTYNLDSVAIREASATAGNVFLGVYSGYSSGALSGFLGGSDNSWDFSTSTDGSWLTFSFTGLSVTADSTVGGGSGMLFFAFQTSDTAEAAVGTVRAIHRIDGFGTYPMTTYLATILDTGNPGAFNTRSPEYQANLTVVPEPAVAALIGLAALGLLYARRRAMA